MFPKRLILRIAKSPEQTDSSGRDAKLSERRRVAEEFERLAADRSADRRCFGLTAVELLPGDSRRR
jgi:hypothetical protein